MYNITREAIRQAGLKWENAQSQINSLAEVAPAVAKEKVLAVSKLCDEPIETLDEFVDRTTAVPGTFQELQAIVTEGVGVLNQSAAFLTPPRTPSTNYPDEPNGAGKIRQAFDQATADETDPDFKKQKAICVSHLTDLHTFLVDASGSLLKDISTSSSIGIEASFEELNSYPLLTSQLNHSGYGSTSGSGDGGSSGTTMRRQVEVALRDVLGRIPRPGDCRSFEAALTQSFEVRQIEGRTDVSWRPHSFVGQTDLSGGVTGAQASLYASAALGLDNVLPLLDALYPLRPDADAEDVEARRAIVRSELVEIVNELKLESGPRVSRVNNLLDLLLGDRKPQAQIGGDLLALQDELRLKDANINTLDEELNASNFIVVRDFATNLRISWNNFSTGNEVGKDLGTRLVLLSRALTVAAESVEEVLGALDSVFFGAGERQVQTFPGPESDPQQFILGELFSWITSFTTEEAPHLVQEGGRLGAVAVSSTATKLGDLVKHLRTTIASDTQLPKGLRHARVRSTLQELTTALNRVREVALTLGRTPRGT